ncbi:MAG: DNA-binding response regulator [Betaproteobacteria bacterium]|nr:DNA-binding response regulator [Betaproteobacteria bacterium]
MGVLLIEREAILGRGIRAALAHSGYRVQAVRTAEAALRLARSSAFELVILDLDPHDRDSLDLLQAMRREKMLFPILVLSARDGLNARRRCLDAGADDYLVKPFALGELEARLRALVRRADEPARWRNLGALRFDPAGKHAYAGEEPIVLTVRELSILGLLVEHAGKVVAKDTLFRAVFPTGTDAAPNALEVRVSRLRSKLGPAGVTVRSVRGVGYRLEEAHAGDTPLRRRDGRRNGERKRG